MLWAVYALCLNEECAYTCTLRAWFGQRLPWASVKLGLSSQGGSCVTVKDDNPLDVVASVARIYIHHSPFPLERNIWWLLIWMCFFALRSSSSCGNACLSLYQQHIFGDIEFEVASMSCQHVKFPCVFEDCSVPFLHGRLLWMHVHSWFELWNVGLVKFCAASGCLSSSSNLLQIAWLVRLCYLTVWQNTSEVSSFSPGQIHKQVPVFLTCVKNPCEESSCLGKTKQKSTFYIDFMLKLQLQPNVSPCMTWRKLQPNCDWNCFSYSNTNSDISILFWYRKSFFPFPAISSQHFSLTFWEYFTKSK